MLIGSDDCEIVVVRINVGIFPATASTVEPRMGATEDFEIEVSWFTGVKGGLQDGGV